VDKLKVLLSTQYITIESRQIFSLALNLYSVNNISFVDCFILAQSNQTHATLYTLDKKLAALAKKGS
jgi:predicted nucleic-acid-binding protein